MEENKNITYQNLWNMGKSGLRGQLITLNAYVRNEKSQISNPSSQIIKNLENEKQTQSKRKEIIMIRAEINETDNRKINETKNRIFEKTNLAILYQDWQKGKEREKEGQGGHELTRSGMKQWVLL